MKKNKNYLKKFKILLWKFLRKILQFKYKLKELCKKKLKSFGAF